ncbi:MAG: host attachment protein [Rhodocyclaceae bacterium]|nr:host attachment protein [Rhodocyclaceae bacterium]
MATTWILVANASQAKLYSNTGPKKGLKLLKELIHPESREKASDLGSATVPARCTVRAPQSSCQPAQDRPEDQRSPQFRTGTGARLNHGRTSSQVERLILRPLQPSWDCSMRSLDGPTQISSRTDSRRTTRKLLTRNSPGTSNPAFSCNQSSGMSASGNRTSVG